MGIRERAKKQIFNIMEWIINLIIVGFATTQHCIDCSDTLRSHFTNAVLFGYFIVNSLVVIAIFIENQEFTKTWKYIFCGCGIILFLGIAALILEYASTYEIGGNHILVVVIVAVLAIIMVIIYLVEIIYMYKNKNFEI